MKKGFTLIEVLVSSALFFVIISSGLVAFSTFLKFYELANKKRISLHNLSFAVEEISREARVGHDYIQEDLSTGQISIDSPQRATRIHFRRGVKSVGTDIDKLGFIESCRESTQSVCDASQDNWIPLTDVNLINITDLQINPLNSADIDDIVQPRLSIFVSGVYETRAGETEEIRLQTQVTQRILDANDTSTFKIETGGVGFSEKIAFVYADNGLCYDDSDTTGFSDNCYNDFTLEGGPIETPCERIILHPTKIVGTTKGIYVLADNGRVYFSKSSDLEDTNDTSIVFNKFYRVKSYPEERNSSVPVGVGPWGIVDIFANPYSKFAYLLDKEGHLFVASPPPTPPLSDEEKAYKDGGLAKEILIDKTTSYKIKHFAVNKDNDVNSYFYIVFDYTQNTTNARVRIFNIDNINSSAIDVDVVVNKITSAVESDDCDGNECIIDFQTDRNGNFYRISDIKISSEIAVAEINQHLALNSVTDSTGTITFFEDKVFPSGSDTDKYTRYEVLNTNFIAKDNIGNWVVYDGSDSLINTSDTNIDKSFIHTGGDDIFDITAGNKICKYKIATSPTEISESDCPAISNTITSDSVRHLAQYNGDSSFVAVGDDIILIKSMHENIKNYEIKEKNPVPVGNLNQCPQ